MHPKLWPSDEQQQYINSLSASQAVQSLYLIAEFIAQTTHNADLADRLELLAYEAYDNFNELRDEGVHNA
jgi:hypothetical protein